jgi:phosphoglycolate phosphatase/AHBA synthesis associated protein
VLFDLDGVLIDSYEVWYSLLNGAARDLGYPAITREQFHASWGQGVEADVQRFFTRHEVADLERYYHAHFGEHAEHLSIADAVPEVFAALRARGLPSAVITNTPGPLARLLVERAGATPDCVVGGTDVPRAKPAPDIVLEACARLGVAPARSWVVGDSRFDRDAARAAGARFAGLGIAGDLELGALGDLLGHLASP